MPLVARYVTARSVHRDAQQRRVAWSTASPPVPGVERVLTPGEPERATKAARLVHGVPVDAVTWGEIVAAGGKVGLSQENIEAIAGRR